MLDVVVGLTAELIGPLYARSWDACPGLTTVAGVVTADTVRVTDLQESKPAEFIELIIEDDQADDTMSPDWQEFRHQEGTPDARTAEAVYDVFAALSVHGDLMFSLLTDDTTV